MSFGSLSVEYGQTYSYFYTLKYQHPQKYDFVFGFDKDDRKSINMCMDYVDALYGQSIDIYYELEDLGLLKPFVHKYYKGRKGNLENVIFKVRNPDKRLQFKIPAVRILEGFIENYMKEVRDD